MLCRSGGITGGRYTMKATVLRPDAVTSDPTNPNNTGTWVDNQDPDTGEIVRVWVPNPDDPTTTAIETNSNVIEVPCLARGIVDGGIRAAATTESFDDIYRNVDIINVWIPKKYRITKRDRVTNIRDKRGKILWRDEENETDENDVKATVFNVNGVVPVFDPFNNHIDNFCLLERAEI